MEYSRSLALVIGLDLYQSLPRLPGAARSAEAVASVLRWVYRFEVATLYNQQATRGAVTRELNRLADAERTVIYFAGRVTGDDTLAVYNTDPNLAMTGISMERLLRQFDALPARHALLVLDAVLEDPAALESFHEISAPLSERFTQRARLVIGAGSSAWQSRERWGDDDASLFTAHVLNGLRGNAADAQGTITGDQLASYLLAALPSRAQGKFTPWVGRAPNAPGDLLFREVAPLELPDEIAEGLRSGYPSLRYRAVGQIAALIDSRDPIMTPLAIEKLREVAAENDSINVRKKAADELIIRRIAPDAKDIPDLREPSPPRPGAETPAPSNAPPPPLPGDRLQNLLVMVVIIAVFATVAFVILHFS